MDGTARRSPKSGDQRITIGLSTSALFDMRESHAIYKDCVRDGNLGPYKQHMIDTADKPLMPGHAFELVNTIGALNAAHGTTIVDIILVSRNSLETGTRAIASCVEYGLPFSGAFFVNGGNIHDYLKPYGIDWLITDQEEDAVKAHEMGIPACTISSPLSQKPPLCNAFNGSAKKGIHVIWDLDRVLLGSEADDVYTTQGPTQYDRHESERAHLILDDGPFTGIARIFGMLAKGFENDGRIVSSILSMRGGRSAQRAINSLRDKGVDFNGESHLSGGMLLKDGEKLAKPLRKHMILEMMAARYPNHALFFLDDSRATIENASKVIPCGLVPREGGLALGEPAGPA